jgi:fermentation-respiration switch protein FrsA (DUF1100 family)
MMEFMPATQGLQTVLQVYCCERDRMLEFFLFLERSRMGVFERAFIFFPERDFCAVPSDGGMAYEDVYLHGPDGRMIHGWFIPGRGNTVVLFFHGNGGNISHRIEKIHLLFYPEISSLMIDYRGYGRSHGKPSEKACYLNALTSWEYLVRSRHFGPNQIVLFGESLGGAVAVDLASKKDVGAVILESTFPNIGVVANRFVPFISILLRRKFDSLSKISSVHVPLLQLHGEEDDLVPQPLGQKLFEAANEPKVFYSIKGAQHNDTYTVGGEPYVQTIQRFVEHYAKVNA